MNNFIHDAVDSNSLKSIKDAAKEELVREKDKDFVKRFNKALKYAMARLDKDSKVV